MIERRRDTARMALLTIRLTRGRLSPLERRLTFSSHIGFTTTCLADSMSSLLHYTRFI